MKKYLILTFIIFFISTSVVNSANIEKPTLAIDPTDSTPSTSPSSSPSSNSSDNSDEYRDCIVYTPEEAMENTAPDNNIVIFTYSDKTSRAFHTNVDCAIPAVEETTPPENNNNQNNYPQGGHSGGSNK